MSVQASHRLTPSNPNSPFFRGSSPRSPTRGKTQEMGLSLKQVIGTTTSSVNGFDCLPAARSFAFTAGAAAVIASVDEDFKVTQRFFRARPNQAATNLDTNGYAPVSPTPGTGAARYRTINHVREQSGGLSPLSGSTRDWSETPSGKSTGAKDRIKAATSVALSPNGKWLAVGEVRGMLMYMLKPRSLSLDRLQTACFDLLNSKGCIGRHSSGGALRAHIRRPRPSL